MKKEEKQVSLFQGNEIRKIWSDEEEKWYFSVVDVVMTLSGSTIPKRYWSDLKSRLNIEGSEVYDKIVQLKF